MSAATEELLTQIIDLEESIKQRRSSGEDTFHLEEQLVFLRERFITLNESLKKNSSLLKG